MLVDSFISGVNSGNSGLKQAMQAAIEEAGARWRELLLTRTLPWYAQEKAAQGSHAAFTCVRLVPLAVQPSKRRLFFQKTAYKWEAAAVGDVCVFIVGDDGLIDVFPIGHAAEFDNTPSLISSLHGGDDAQIVTKSGELRQGDTVFLLSDALAEWFLRSCESGLSPWKTLSKIKSEAAFGLFIKGLRETRQMKNDDATLMAIPTGKLP